ncbi:hypothetical protein [Roseicyclus marinus]|uniref:hypothetical protein n=1 Tax=Roseicyclus marinus TaxID=2161673 RepID=UPI0024106B9C|nr:hypothetical protein [Roseicyclus marinus]MDG3039677.1 hypothetical protein [Roseicyclus marinus]
MDSDANFFDNILTILTLAWGVVLGLALASLIVEFSAKAIKKHSLPVGRTILNVTFFALIYFSMFVWDPPLAPMLSEMHSTVNIGAQLALALMVGIPYVVIGLVFILFSARSTESVGVEKAGREDNKEREVAESDQEMMARIRREEEYRLQVRRTLEGEKNTDANS